MCTLYTLPRSLGLFIPVPFSSSWQNTALFLIGTWNWSLLQWPLLPSLYNVLLLLHESWEGTWRLTLLWFLQSGDKSVPAGSSYNTNTLLHHLSQVIDICGVILISLIFRAPIIHILVDKFILTHLFLAKQYLGNYICTAIIIIYVRDGSLEIKKQD